MNYLMVKYISKKKNLFTVLCCVLFIIGTSAQSLQWVKRGGGGSFDFGDGICSDNSGNMYVTGEYEFNSDFSGTELTCAGLHDIFIAKYNSSGILQWVKSVGGIGGDGGHAISCDADGNVYVTGEFEQSAAFGSDTLKGLGLLNEIFVAKYDSSGGLQWVRKAGGWLADKGRGISTDAHKNVYVIGEFKGTAYFDTITLVSSGDKDAFLSKYNEAGDLQWVRKIGGKGTDDGKAISIDQSGNSYVTGYFSDTASFGSGITLISSGGLDIFIAKYDTLGNLLWAKKGGGIYYDMGRGIVVNNSGLLYVTGEFRYIANFDSLSISSIGKGDIFIACYDSSGNAKWVKNAGGNLDDIGTGISIDSSSNIYITGQFGNISTFGTTKVVGDSADIFIASYDSSGNFRWMQTAGSDTLDSGNGVSVDDSGGIHITGSFGHVSYFSNDSVKSSGHTEFFIAKYSKNLTAEPDNASSNLISSPVNSNSIQINWTAGNGNRHIVLATTDSTVNLFPLDGRSYTANSSFGAGSNLGNNNHVVYNDTGNSATVTGLSPCSTYYFAIFEYNGSGVNTNYFTTNYATAIANTDSINVTLSFTDTVICSGTSIKLSASGAVSYKWFPAIELSDSTIANPLAFPIATTTYTVTGISNTCSDTATVTIVVKPSPIVTVTDSTSVCSGDSILLTANGADTYNWLPTMGLSNSTIANPMAFPTSSSTYTVTGTTNTCSDTAIVKIVVKPSPIVTVTDSTSVCSGDSILLTANGADTYNWLPTMGLSNSTIANPMAFPTSSSTYTVTGTTNACTDTATVTVVVKPSPIVIVVDSTSVCSGDSILLTANGADTYNWLPTMGLSNSSIANPLAFPIATITYTVTGISNSCTDTAITTVIVNNTPELFLGADTLICANGSLTLNAGSGFVNYNWSNGLHTPTINVDSAGVGLSSKKYYLFASDANTCSAIDSIQVTYSVCTDVYQQQSNPYHISIYPNPTEGIFNIQLSGIKKELLKIKMFNTLGGLVYEEEQTVTDGDFIKVIDLRNFVNGIYLLRIESSEEPFSTKILIQGNNF